MWVLECLRDKIPNMFFAGLAIPDVSGIDTGRVRYVPSHDKILVVLGLIHREFWRKSGGSMVGSSGNRREFWCLMLNWLGEVHMPWGSGVLTVGSSDTSHTLTQLPWFSNVLRVGSFDGREFQHLSGVPMPHNVTVTQLPLAQCKSYRTCPVWQWL